LKDAERAEVEKEIQFYARYDEFIVRAAERARPYLHFITESIERRQMPAELALLPIVESAFMPQARSPSGALGVWQFMPATARNFGLTQTKWYDGRRDVLASTEAALDYLQALHERFDGDWLNAIAAYNCGERNVARAIEANRAAGRPTDFWSLDLPGETRMYVPRLLALRAITATPLRYGVTLEPIPNEPYLAEVDVSSQIDLEKAAVRGGVDPELLRTINPGYPRGVTTPGVHRIVVPADRAEAFRQMLVLNIADLGPDLSRLKPDRSAKGSMLASDGHREHRVRSGENLGAIAGRYDVTVEALRELNEVNPKRLRIGQVLLIPTAERREGERAVQSVAANGPAPVANPVSAGVDGANKVIHTVQAGDSLWTIARGYDVHVSDIVAWNAGLTAKSVLKLNQKLVVYTERTGETIAQTETGSTGEFVKVGAEQPGDGSFKLVRYEVRTGDSLWTIAQRFNVDVEQLRRWNGIEPQKVLKPGESLDVYVVSADDDADASRI
jgi:membrane-bound lytic murein transglycosylase D